jgi:gliding motility-associated-like protein
VVDSAAEAPAAFNLLWPPDGSRQSYLKLSFDWEDTTDPDPGDAVQSYTLYYSTLSNLSASTSVNGIVLSTYTLASALDNNTTYYWQVKAISAVSGETYSNTQRSFYATNLAPGNFDLISSSGLLRSDTGYFAWTNPIDPEGDPISFTLYYSSYQNFSSYLSSAGIAGLSVSVPGLTENGTYYWYVEAKDIWDNKTLSNTWRIWVNATDEPPLAFSLASPADHEQVDTLKPDIVWDQALDPDPGDVVSYTLWYSTDQNFVSKTAATGLTAPEYKITDDLLAHTTYYWRVFARGLDNLEKSSLTRDFHVTRELKPKAPAGFLVETGANRASCRLSWEAVTENEENAPLADLAGYRVYKAFNFDDAFTVSFVTDVPKAIRAWTDNGLNKQTAYYIVKAYTVWNVEGYASSVIRAGAENLSYFCSDDKVLRVSCANGVIPSTITLGIQRNTGDENELIARAYTVTAVNQDGGQVNFIFPETARLEFNDPAFAEASSFAKASEDKPSFAQASLAPLRYGIFWNNGVEWTNLGGIKDSDAIACEITRLGSYQLRVVSRATEFKRLSSWPKIITPNGDGINDEFNFTFDNPAQDKIEGKIFDLSGSLVAYMSLKTDSWLSWNGGNLNNSVVAPGLYVYQVKCGTKVFNGTVVVAR